MYEGDPNKLEYVYKKLCIYSYMFELQSPPEYSPFDAIRLSRWFSHCSNSFWAHRFGCLVVLLLFFVSPLPHPQNISLGGHFLSGETKRSHLVWGWVNRKGGTWGSCWFLVKHCWTLSMRGAGELINHPSWNWQTHCKSLQKKFTEAKCSLSQQRLLVHGYRWVPRTLT